MQALATSPSRPTRADALWSWLSAAASRSGVEALLIADRSGLLIASNLPGRAAEALAAMAPGAAAGEVSPMRTAGLEALGRPLLVAAVGAPARCDRALASAVVELPALFEIG